MIYNYGVVLNHSSYFGQSLPGKKVVFSIHFRKEILEKFARIFGLFVFKARLANGLKNHDFNIIGLIYAEKI